jgi:hypothetical protein
MQAHYECGCASAHTESFDDDDHLDKQTPSITINVREIRQSQQLVEQSNEK